MAENKESSNKKIIIGLLLALLVGLGVYTFKTNAKNQEAKQFLEQEKEQIVSNLTSMEEKYDKAISENTTLSDELKLEKERIVSLRDSVKNLKNANWGVIRRYRSRIAKLEKINERLLYETDSLKLVNNLLVVEKDSITGKLIEQTNYNDTLVAKNMDLAKKVEIGGAMRVSSVSAAAMRLRSNGKYAETNKAPKTKAIRVGFRLDKNEIAQPGEKIAHVTITTPSGKIVSQKGTFTARDGSEVGYTDQTTVEYENAAKDVVLFVNSLGELKKGVYGVKVYVDNNLVGATKLELKDAFLGL